jgi:hypothetical protein
MSVKLIPGKPAVTETFVKVISPSTPASVQVEMTILEAYLVTFLLGRCNGTMSGSLYNKFREVLDYKTYKDCSNLVKNSLGDRTIETTLIQNEFQKLVNKGH